ALPLDQQHPGARLGGGACRAQPRRPAAGDDHVVPVLHAAIMSLSGRSRARWRGATPCRLPPVHTRATSSATRRATARLAVAAGEGALATTTIAPRRTRTKSSTSRPPPSTAWARTPEGPAT